MDISDPPARYSGRVASLCWCVALVILCASAMSGQELEPRAYSVSPVGVNFVVMTFARASGDLSFDPALPIEDAASTLHNVVMGYGRAIDFFGRTANFAIAVPYTWGSAQGLVNGVFAQGTRSGLGDSVFRFAVNLYGARAMNLEKFREYRQKTTIGASVVVIVPTGQYSDNRYVNIGSNRWAVKPEVGLSRRVNRWYFDLYLGIWMFGTNTDFNGSVRKQDALGSTQLHVSYNITRRMWAAFDANYYTGGRTTTNGVAEADLQRNSRVGGTLAVPVTKHQSIKFNYSTGARTNIGASFNTIGVAYQYTWGGGV
jgi:hypothetical protein